MRIDGPAAPLDYESSTRKRRRFWPGIVIVTIFVAILVFLLPAVMPQLNPPHVNTTRNACANNLRQLGLAAIMYANTHNMKMPDELQTLFDSEELATGVLVCPASNLPSLIGATTQAADASIKSKQVSYVYLGKGLTLNAPADTVLMYEPIGDHGDGMNVLFVDAHVEWLDLTEAKKLIARIGSGQNPVRYPDPTSPTQP
jgi:prepilin-type processing-associated H-X9-DG protein